MDKAECQRKKETTLMVKKNWHRPTWRVRAGPRNTPTQKDREEHEATNARTVSEIGAILHDGQRAYSITTSTNKKARISREDPPLRRTATSRRLWMLKQCQKNQ